MYLAGMGAGLPSSVLSRGSCRGQLLLIIIHEPPRPLDSSEHGNYFAVWDRRAIRTSGRRVRRTLEIVVVL